MANRLTHIAAIDIELRLCREACYLNHDLGVPQDVPEYARAAGYSDTIRDLVARCPKLHLAGDVPKAAKPDYRILARRILGVRDHSARVKRTLGLTGLDRRGYLERLGRWDHDVADALVNRLQFALAGTGALRWPVPPSMCGKSDALRFLNQCYGSGTRLPGTNLPGACLHGYHTSLPAETPCGSTSSLLLLKYHTPY